MEAKFKELVDVISRPGSDLKRLELELAKGDFDVNYQDKKGYTLLHVATKRNNPEAILTILQCSKVNPNLKNTHGRTALLESVKQVKMKALEALLKSEKVDLDEPDNEHDSLDDYVTGAPVSEATKNGLRSLVEKRRSRVQGIDTSGK